MFVHQTCTNSRTGSVVELEEHTGMDGRPRSVANPLVELCNLITVVQHLELAVCSRGSVGLYSPLTPPLWVPLRAAIVWHSCLRPVSSWNTRTSPHHVIQI